MGKFRTLTKERAKNIESGEREKKRGRWMLALIEVLEDTKIEALCIENTYWNILKKILGKHEEHMLGWSQKKREASCASTYIDKYVGKDWNCEWKERKCYKIERHGLHEST